MNGLGQEALAMARRVGDRAALTYTLGCIINFTSADVSSRHRKLTAFLDEALLLVEETGDKRAALHFPRFRVIVSLARGERDVADEAIELEGRLSAELRMRGGSPYPSLQARLEGRLDEVEALAQQWFVEARRSYPWVAPFFFGAQMFDLRRAQGRLGEIEGAVQRAVAADQVPLMAPSRAMLTLVYKEQDRREEARALFDEVAADGFRALTDDRDRPFLLEMLAEVCCYLNDEPAAAILYELLLPLAGYCIVFGMATVTTGSASAPLGALATTLGRFDDAERHFEDAIAMNRKLRAPTWVADAQCNYGDMLLRRNGPGDRDRAVALLNEALAFAKECGMGKAQHDCERLLATLT